MTPRSSRLQAQRTRASILDRAVEVASVEGLEGLTIGRLAADLELSKSALFGHFGSKETLQLAVVERAAEIFGLAVAERATGLLPGLSKLRALLAAWVAYLERPVFPGGCFFIAATAEFDDRPGVVRDAIVGLATLWRNDLRRQVAAAIAQGELAPGTDPDQIVFELNGVMLALNHEHRLYADGQASARARRSVESLLARVLPAETTRV